MNKYDSYKESEVEWIGDIPEHWKMVKLKYLGKSLIGLSYKPEDIVDNEKEGILVLRSSNIQNGKLSLDDNVYVNTKIKDDIIVREGDILICSRNGSSSLIGKNITITRDLEGNTFGVFMTVFRSPHWKYLSKIFNSKIFTNQSGLFLTSTINQLTQDTLNSFVVPFVRDQNEQHKIVQYLDTKTTLIDTLIQKTQEKINLLKEKRISLINHTVTKGLNHDIELKDSGIGWIGEIPKHWEVCKLKYISELITDGSHFSPEIQDEGRFYISVSDITKENSINFENCKKINNKSFDELEKNGCRPKKGDILITKDGTIGRGTIVNDFNDFVILSSLGLIRLKKEHFNKFFLHYLLSGLNIDQMYSHIRGSGITRLTIKLINDLLVVVPDFSEQVQIVKYLDYQSELIDTLIQKEEKRVELLKEYRQTLISNVVTGKIKVTGYE